jgi:hypothetical protein
MEEQNMSRVVELSEQVLAEPQQLTNQAEASTAVRVALTEYLRYARRMQLKDLSGRITMEDNWQALEMPEGNSDRANPEPAYSSDPHFDLIPNLRRYKPK